MSKFLNFVKFEHTIFSLPLVFAGAYLGAGERMPDPFKLLLVLLAATGARTFGMAANRILDRHIDAKNPRTSGRELPAGKMSLRMGFLFAALGLAVFVASCALLGPMVLALSPIPAVLLGGYSMLKRFTWLCHYGIGAALGIAPLAAYAAVSGNLDAPPAAWFLALFTFFWISGYDIVYALLDERFDRDHRVYSIPGRFGRTRALMISGAGHLIAALFLVLFTGALGWNVTRSAVLAGSLGTLAFSYLPFVPVATRFFPLSSVVSVLGAAITFLGRLP